MGEGKERHRRRIDRSFAISAREVTVAEFRRSGVKHQHSETYGPTLDCPVNGVSWFDAAAYCNWLSKEEGIPKDQWCYLEDEKSIRPAADFLKRTGYRLPTEAEWEFACRAGSSTGWSHGDGEDLLAKYAWYNSNSHGKTHPAGSLRPNGLGLFDMHGNAWEWCQDKHGELKKEEGDSIIEDIGDIEDKVYKESSRMLRGGSFSTDAVNVRSANRSWRGPAYRDNYLGFRPARTFR
jgi:formylglycine-generating enzyme required for sulfatase activity